LSSEIVQDIEEQEQRDPEHQELVEKHKILFTSLGFRICNPHMIHNEFYHPDHTITTDNVHFIVIDEINGSYNFDVLGIFSLVELKDIVSFGVCIISDKLYNSSSEKFDRALDQIRKFSKYSKSLYNNEIVFLRELEVESWFKQRIAENENWKPELMK
jgi:hypothetical protein